MRQMSYGRIVLGKQQKQVSFSSETQETGLICVSGSGVARVGDEQFTLTPGDALYVSKGLPIVVETTSELDLVECSAPVDGDYPLQFISGRDVRLDEKLHFMAGIQVRTVRSLFC
jgi:5-deoxy-glucuronate isomerase